MFTKLKHTQRLAIGIVTAGLLGTGLATATAADSSSAWDYEPSAHPAAGPERGTKAGSRPESGKTPKAGPTFTQGGDTIWDVNTTQAALRNTVTDADGEKSTLTFEVWTVGADGKPASRVKLTDANEYGVLVSDPVASGKTAEVRVPWNKLKRGTKYMFRTSAYDGSLYETDWSPWATFKIEGKLATNGNVSAYGQVTDNTDLNSSDVYAWMAPDQDKEQTLAVGDTAKLVSVPADKIKASGNQFTIAVDPATVPADYKTDSGLVQFEVAIVDKATKKMAWTTATAIATGNTTNAWAEPHAHKAAQATKTTTAAPVPEWNMGVKAPAPDAFLKTTRDGIIGDSSTKTLGIDNVEATIGSSYPVGDGTARLEYQSGESVSYGVAYAAADGIWSSSGSATVSNSKNGGFNWKDSKENRVYRSRVDVKRTQYLIGGAPAHKSAKPIEDTGGYTHTPITTTAPNWTDGDGKSRCHEQSEGEWFRSAESGENYTLSYGLKVSDILGIDLSTERQYTKGSRLVYNMTKEAKVLCGDNDFPGQAGKVAQYFHW